MKKTLIVSTITILIVLTMTLINACSSASGEAWKENITWTDPGSLTHEQLVQTGKSVFVFFQTDRCTFCTKMKNEALANEKVQEILNKHFISMVINPQKNGRTSFTGEDLSYVELAKKMGVSDYPATYFFDKEGRIIAGQPGYLTTQQLTDLTGYIGRGFYLKMKFQDYLSISPANRLKF